MENPYDPVVLKKAQEDVFSMLLSKAKNVTLIPWLLELNFKEGDLKAPRKFEKLWRYALLSFFSIEVLFTGIDLLVSLLKKDSSEASTKQV
jgi:hypothetical protein